MNFLAIYWFLILKIKRLEQELKTARLENEKLEKQKSLLRTSNDNLNKELETMHELRQQINEKDSLIETLQDCLQKDKLKNEDAWNTGEFQYSVK